MDEQSGLPDLDDPLSVDTKEDLPPADDWERANEFLKKHLSLDTYNDLRLPRKSVSMDDAIHLVKRFGDTRYFRVPG